MPHVMGFIGSEGPTFAALFMIDVDQPTYVGTVLIDTGASHSVVNEKLSARSASSRRVQRRSQRRDMPHQKLRCCTVSLSGSRRSPAIPGWT
jgi:hypothetical protein